MNRRKNYSRGKLKHTIIKWSIVIVLVFCLAGVGYAAHTNALYSIYGINTSNMNFIFDQNEYITMQIINSSAENKKVLIGNTYYKDNILNITDIGPLDINDFKDGDAVIMIKYAIKAEDDKTGLVRPAEIKHPENDGYDLKTVCLKLTSKTPFWSLENGDNIWGTKSNEIKSTPLMIYTLLPKSLGEFQFYNELRPSQKDGIMEGILTLKQKTGPDFPETKEIELSSLGLSNEICNSIQNDSHLEIKGTYSFSIPLYLNQFNVER